MIPFCCESKNIVSDKHERGTELPIETNTKLFEIIYGRNIRKLNWSS